MSTNFNPPHMRFTIASLRWQPMSLMSQKPMAVEDGDFWSRQLQTYSHERDCCVRLAYPAKSITLLQPA
jgi:hypothetical protein